eukprot:m.340079 g.340079  ORF g.340079 m.340079 type:complete len:72 (+) comp27824_c1_seq11:289-504(+)
MTVDFQYLYSSSQPGVESGAVLRHRFHDTDSAILLVFFFWSDAEFLASELLAQCRPWTFWGWKIKWKMGIR